MPAEIPANYVTVRIGGYETTYPLPEDTSEALALLTPLNWSELGNRFMRHQREAPRTLDRNNSP